MVSTLKWRLVIVTALMWLTITPVANSQSRLPDVTHEGIEIKEVWIPMPDGVRLAASLFMPADRDATAKFPVLLEYLPYRKDESRNDRFQAVLLLYQAGLYRCASGYPWYRNQRRQTDRV